MTEEAPHPYTPETREVPLTRFDCDEYSWLMDCHGFTRICKLRQPGLLMFRYPIDCKEWCDHKECPLGFSS